MENQQLSIEGDDFNDFIIQIEKSFKITLMEDDFFKGMTFGALCQCIHSKLNREDKGGCTSQQAFYKIRGVLATDNPAYTEIITPNTPLENVLGQNKKEAVNNLKLKLGIQADLFETPVFIALPLSLIIFISFIAMFFKWEFAWAFGGSILILYVASKITTNLRFKIIRELVDYLTVNEYNTVRRHTNTYNSNEIEKIVKQLFTNTCALEDDELTSESIIL